MRVWDYLIAIPNEGKRDPKVGAKHKKLGLKPGVSDLFLAYPMTSVHGMWIEMKKPRRDFRSENEADNAATEEQQEWITKMNAIGYMAFVCYGADDTIETIKTYLGIQR
jgi:hypothetical protein